MVGQILRIELSVDDLDEGGKAWSRPSGGADPDPLRVHQSQVVEGEDRVVGQVGIGTDPQDGLHVLVSARAGNVVEPVEAVGHVVDAAPLGDLAELDGGHPDVGGVPRRDVAVLIERPVPESAPIRVCQCHQIHLPVEYVRKSVRSCPSLVRRCHNRTVNSTVGTPLVRHPDLG